MADAIPRGQHVLNDAGTRCRFCGKPVPDEGFGDGQCKSHILGPGPMAQHALSLPDWSSFLLSLGSDIAVSMAIPGEAVPAQPNVLQLHRAVGQENWYIPAAGHPPLPPPAVFALPRFGSRIYFRQSYRWIMDELPLAKAERSSVQHGLGALGVAINGNAGIGKSTLLAVKIHQDLQPVVGRNRPTIVFIFHNWGQPLVACLRGAAAPAGAAPPRLQLQDITYAADSAPFRSDISSSETKLYIDVGAKGKLKVGLPMGNADTLVALSPAAAESDAILAWKNKGALLVDRYLSNWSLMESEECRRLIRPDVAAEVVLGLLGGEVIAAPVAAALVRSRYQLYGGIARSIFVDTDEDLHKRKNKAVDNCNIREIIDLAGRGSLHQLVKGEFSSILFHYRVNECPPLTNAQRQAVHLASSPVASTTAAAAAAVAVVAVPIAPPTSLPFTLLEPSVQVATDEIKELLYQHFLKDGAHEVVKFITACTGHPSLGTIRGDMWQPFANSVMQTSPLLWRQRIDPVTGARVGAVTQYQFQVNPIAPLHLHTLASFQQLAAQQFGVPSPLNWPTLDAVLEPNVTLQWTVSHKHSVNEGGLHDAYQQLQIKAAATAAAAALAAGGVPPVGPPAALRMEHHFGVPSDKFGSYSLTPGDFVQVAGKPCPLSVDYFVLLVEDSAAQKKRKVSRSH